MSRKVSFPPPDLVSYEASRCLTEDGFVVLAFCRESWISSINLVSELLGRFCSCLRLEEDVVVGAEVAVDEAKVVEVDEEAKGEVDSVDRGAGVVLAFSKNSLYNIKYTYVHNEIQD